MATRELIVHKSLFRVQESGIITYLSVIAFPLQPHREYCRNVRIYNISVSSGGSSTIYIEFNYDTINEVYKYKSRIFIDNVRL